MSPHLLRRADHLEMPWRNGGGSTLEVARHPAGGDLDDFDWRVSFARVGQDGPFSAFPGVDRVITLVEGDAMSLTLHDPYAASRTVALQLHEPFAFAGECAVDCRVSSPTTDLNLMTRRDRVAGRVVCHDVEGAPVALDPVPVDGASRLLAVLAGALTADLGDGAIELGSLDVVADATGALTVTGRGVLAEITVEPRQLR